LGCEACSELAKPPGGKILKGIISRIHDGIREGTNLAFFGLNGLRETIRRKDSQIETLRLGKLTAARALESKARTIDDWKRLYMSLASGKVQNCERLLAVAVNHKRGVKGALKMYVDAALRHYRPRRIDETSALIGIVLWRIGGARVANFAHRALNLPGLSTLRRYSTMQPIIASYRFPRASDIEQNLHAILSSGLLDVLKGLPDDCVQLVLMIDEIATEKRLRWDPRTNQILGLCREHGECVSVSFNSVEDVEELMKALEEGRVHYASEVCSHSHDARLISSFP
jgi:hypothetical protein